MIESNTFSACVDDVIARAGQPNRRNDIISYCRQTLRECQVLGFFDQDREEDQLTTTAAPHIWTVNDRFRGFETVRYPTRIDPQNNSIYPQEKKPGRGQRGLDFYYYRSGNYYAFAGLNIGELIDISYFRYFRRFSYYLIENRPARFNVETESWTYLAAVTNSEQEAARELVTCWLLQNWYDTIVEGTLAKLFKTVKDDRAVSSFALYKSLQNTLLMGEPHAGRAGNLNK